MKKILIFPNEVSSYTNLKRGTRFRRFWGYMEQTGSGEELRLVFRPPFSNRVINDAIQNKLMDLFRKEGFVLKRVQSHLNRDLQRLYKEIGVDIV